MKKTNDSINYQAYTMIRDMILCFDLEPGQRVSDFTLSKQLGISRTPVREALASLVKDGLVTMSEKGQIVRKIDAGDLTDLCHMREALETMMLRLTIQNGELTAQDIAQMRAFNDEMIKMNQANQIHLTFEIDERLHDYIAVKSKSSRMLEQFRVSQLQMRRYRFLTLIDDQRSALTVREHADIIDALEARDIHAAEEAMRAHLHITVERYKNALQRMSAKEWIRLIRNLTSPQALKTLYPGRSDIA
ncbi:GntR family transcriptional regulator [Anaerotruncus rubiinfantis]|jgi:DNA-binding GntR family transcriptional regulator|uniref:GntR family transcriptional regulator n=2 Tax=Anaerotruncus rubiinfantis TaxID=1720200 RepID=UPI0008326880|nr:GntR family transcriptional regulator [Anaerotruncus rubiinfantis]